MAWKSTVVGIRCIAEKVAWMQRSWHLAYISSSSSAAELSRIASTLSVMALRHFIRRSRLSDAKVIWLRYSRRRRKGEVSPSICTVKEWRSLPVRNCARDTRAGGAGQGSPAGRDSNRRVVGRGARAHLEPLQAGEAAEDAGALHHPQALREVVPADVRRGLGPVLSRVGAGAHVVLAAAQVDLDAADARDLRRVRARAQHVEDPRVEHQAVAGHPGPPVTRGRGASERGDVSTRREERREARRQAAPGRARPHQYAME